MRAAALDLSKNAPNAAHKARVVRVSIVVYHAWAPHIPLPRRIQCYGQRACRLPVAASRTFAAGTALCAQQGIDQAVIVIVGRTERQAARLKEVAASKLPCAERVVLAVIEIPHTAPAIRRAAE